MSLPERISTERLELRPWRVEDADDVFAYANDEEWSRFLPIPLPYEREHAIAFIKRHMEQDPALEVGWALEHEGKASGGIELRLDRPNRRAFLGWAIARRLWGQGLMSEAARAVIDAAFREEDLHTIRAGADARNIGSIRVMEKIGMQREGLFRQNRVMREEICDEVWYGVLRDEWERSR